MTLKKQAVHSRKRTSTTRTKVAAREGIITIILTIGLATPQRILPERVLKNRNRSKARTPPIESGFTERCWF